MLETSAALAEVSRHTPTTPADADIIASLLAPPTLAKFDTGSPPPPVATAPSVIEFEFEQGQAFVGVTNLPMLSRALLGPAAKRRSHRLDCTRARRFPVEPTAGADRTTACRRRIASRHRRGTAAQRGSRPVIRRPPTKSPCVS